MLVPTMTPEEIYAEIRKDANPLWDAISMRFGNEFQRIVRRSQLFPLIKGYTWQSKNTKIEYNVVFSAYSCGKYLRKKRRYTSTFTLAGTYPR